MTEPTIEEGHIDIPYGRVFVRTWSPRDTSAATPLVLLHDSLGCVDAWRDFPRRLARTVGRTVIAYDRLGFGRSTPRHELPSLRFIEEEATVYFPAVRDALGIRDFSLLGHSVGGAMALMVAASRPAGCDSVITESAQAFIEPRTLAGIRATQVEFRQPETFRKLVRRHGDRAQWVLDAWTQTWLSPAFASWSLEPWLGLVECPVLAIHGDADEYGSLEFPRCIVRGVRGPSRLAVVDNCGHVPHKEHPEQVLDLVTAFLASGDSRVGER